MRKFLSQIWNKKPEEVTKAAAIKREQIMEAGALAKRLMVNEDFGKFMALLKEDKDILIANLLDESSGNMKTAEERVRLIARINQIDKVLGKPRSMVWQMESLTEVRTAMKEQTRVRQAHGNKTGGEEDGN